VHRRNERQQNSRGTIYRSSIKAAQLLLEDIGILETEAKPANPEIHVHAVPALLVNADIDGSKRHRRVLRGFKDKRIIRDQRFFFRLLSLSEKIELGAIQTDEAAPVRDCRSNLLAEVDVRSKRDLHGIFSDRGRRDRWTNFFL